MGKSHERPQPGGGARSYYAFYASLSATPGWIVLIVEGSAQEDMLAFQLINRDSGRSWLSKSVCGLEALEPIKQYDACRTYFEVISIDQIAPGLMYIPARNIPCAS
jgi:hypothetical protein